MGGREENLLVVAAVRAIELNGGRRRELGLEPWKIPAHVQEQREEMVGKKWRTPLQGCRAPGAEGRPWEKTSALGGSSSQGGRSAVEVLVPALACCCCEQGGRRGAGGLLLEEEEGGAGWNFLGAMDQSSPTPWLANGEELLRAGCLRGRRRQGEERVAARENAGVGVKICQVSTPIYRSSPRVRVL
jgi:choline dehydrogenase-like flavoprotein